MELNAEGWMLLVLDAHDFTDSIRSVRPRCYIELVRQRVIFDHKAVVTRCGHRLRKTGEDTLPFVMNLIRLAVHQSFGSDNFSAGCLSDRLVSEADAQHRHAPMKVLNAID